MKYVTEWIYLQVTPLKVKRQERYSGSPALSALIALMLAVISLPVRGQTYPFRDYTSIDGLPQTQQANVMQDSRGYLWIPTRNGLALSDGHTFTSFLRKDGLPSNLVIRVMEDSSRTIWAVTLNGLARFNGKKFIGYPLPDSLGIKNLGPGCAGRDSASFIVPATMNNKQYNIILFEDDRYQNLSERHPALRGHGNNFVPVASDANDSTIYFIEGEKRVYKYHNDTLNLIYSGTAYNVRLVDGKPEIQTELDSPPVDPEQLRWEGTNPVFLFVDRDETLWLGTETRIYRLVSDAFTEYDRENGLPGETWALAADRDGGLWTGSLYGELRYFDGKEFHDRNDYMDKYGERVAFFRGSTTLSNGDVWISTNTGVLIWDGKNFSKLRLVPDKMQVCIIYEDPVDKTIFLGTDIGLFRIDGKRVDFFDQMTSLSLGVTEGITRDHHGNYWLAGHYGMVFFDGKDFTPFRGTTAPAEMAWGVVCDYKGSIWSASSDGLFICDPDNPGFRAALPEEINMPASVIRDMGDNRLLVGRMLDLCIIDLDKFYSGNKDYYDFIGRNEGFDGVDCQDNGIVRDTAGIWWILTTDKLIAFDPGRFTKNGQPPITHITMVETTEDGASWEAALDSALFYDTNNQLTIRGRQNRIRITYTGISTRNPEGVTYQYRLAGQDNNWSQQSTLNTAVFNDLSPGNYTFEVRSFNSDNVMSGEPDILNIKVAPTFFQTFVARFLRVLTVLALLGLLIWKVRARVTEQKIEAARQQAERYRLQLNAVIKQFDPHFTFNAVTSVGSLIMKGEKERAYQYFIKLSNLLRSILADSSTLLKPLEEELDFVTQYCELQKLRFGHRFDYTVDVAPGVSLKAPVPKMIIQSFVENAIKHGLENKKGKGTVDIKMKNIRGGTEVIVRDNGIGRAAASDMHTEGARMGLKNLASIIDTINKANSEKITFTFTDMQENGIATGTEVKVFLPFNYSYIIAGEAPSSDNK